MLENANEVAVHADTPESGARALFVIDARRSRFTVQAFATGILSAMGHNPTIGIRAFKGQVEFDPEALEAAAFRLAVQSASLGVLDDISDRDRREIERVMRADVLDIDGHPEIRFESSSISVTRIDGSLNSAILNGNLTLHGVTRSEQIPARIVVMDEMLRVSGDFTLKQSNYRIKPVSVAGGTLKVKDELKFSFEMIARRTDPTG